MEIRPIGIVKSPVIKQKDVNWGEIISEVHLNKNLTSGLTGLSNFSHLIIIFFMHEAKINLENDLVRRPQERSDMPLVGMFAQRSKHRPNPIGITTVELISVHKEIITVKGLDAINDTPVIDIKPYFPIFDQVDAKTPEWVNELMKEYFFGNE